MYLHKNEHWEMALYYVTVYHISSRFEKRNFKIFGKNLKKFFKAASKNYYTNFFRDFEQSEKQAVLHYRKFI